MIGEICTTEILFIPKSFASFSSDRKKVSLHCSLKYYEIREAAVLLPFQIQLKLAQKLSQVKERDKEL